MSFLVLVVDGEPDVEMLFRQEESLGASTGEPTANLFR